MTLPLQDVLFHGRGESYRIYVMVKGDLHVERRNLHGSPE